MKYRKKPVIIDAIRLKKDNITEVLNFMGIDLKTPTFQLQQRFEQYQNSVIENGMDIHTLEDGKYKRAKHVASIGDYIIKGVKGEFYPCKPDIFKRIENAYCFQIEIEQLSSGRLNVLQTHKTH